MNARSPTTAYAVARCSGCSPRPPSAQCSARTPCPSPTTQKDATAGLKAALDRGAAIAVDLLGRTDGFWGNDRVRIPLPEWLQRGERALKILGYGRDIDELKLGVNRAAEQAVPESKVLLTNAVKSMTVADAKNILQAATPRSRASSPTRRARR